MQTRTETAVLVAAAMAGWAVAAASGQGVGAAAVLFENVRVFDGLSSSLSSPTNVLIRNGTIESISGTLPPAAGEPGTTVVRGGGRTLMPGLIDAHVHLVYGASLLTDLLGEGALTRAEAAAAQSAEKMLLRGFTAVRDVGGPIFRLKAAVDAGKVNGPRIWPSGATVSQTSGHGDLRGPDERSRRFFGKPSRAEELGATFIADGRDEVLTAVRENLRLGASQIKLMAGGGTSSDYDPLDVTQYTLDEMKAAVEAAEDWNTYVTAHAYTPRAVTRAIEAGIKCIEHGQLLDETTMALMAKRAVWLSAQNLVPDSPNMTPERREKRKPVIEGQSRTWALAKKHKVKLAWGTDFLFEPELNDQQNRYILMLTEWFTPAEILKLVTYDNAQLLALSGPRSPYPGQLGVVRPGALADLLLVDGDPIANLPLIADPAKNFLVIMKHGVVYKNSLAR
jgi:imidazolonepropionase-like amidohydrolase